MGEDHGERAAFLFAGQQVVGHRENEDRQQEDHHERDVEGTGEQIHRVLELDIPSHGERRAHADRQVIELDIALADGKRRKAGGRQGDVGRRLASDRARVGALRWALPGGVADRRELVLPAAGEHGCFVLGRLLAHLVAQAVFIGRGVAGALGLPADGAATRPRGKADGEDQQREDGPERPGTGQRTGFVGNDEPVHQLLSSVMRCTPSIAKNIAATSQSPSSAKLIRCSSSVIASVGGSYRNGGTTANTSSLAIR